MATAGKSNKEKGQVKPNVKSTASYPDHDSLVDAMLREERTSVETQKLSRPTIRELAGEFLQHPDEWLDHPHPQFGGRTPNEVIAAGQEDKVRNLFECAEFGLF